MDTDASGRKGTETSREQKINALRKWNWTTEVQDMKSVEGRKNVWLVENVRVAGSSANGGAMQLDPQHRDVGYCS
jgi:hypothetical protein